MGKVTPRVVMLSLGASVLLLGGVCFADGDDGKAATPVAVLRSKGLRLAQRRYILDEAGALTKFMEANAAFASFLRTMALRNAMLENDAAIFANEQRLTELRNANAELRIGMDALDARNSFRHMDRWNYDDRTTHQQANATSLQNRSEVLKLEGDSRQRRSLQPKQKDRESIQSDFERLSSDCQSQLNDLTEVMNPIAGKYRELAADKDVKDALAALNRATKGNLKLGPSDRFRDAHKSLQVTKKALKPQQKPAVKPKNKRARP
jgi:hypothetical protein